MSERTPPLPPELDELIAADARATLGTDREQKAIRARVLATLGLVPPGGGSPGPSGSASSGIGGAAKGLLAIAIVTGGSVGGYLLLRDGSEATQPTRAQVTTPAAETTLHEEPATEVPAAALPTPEPQVTATPAAAKTRRDPPKSARAPATRAEPPVESDLIEAAWSALARKDSAAVFAALRRHQCHYPSGRLAEEREALRVLALARAGQSEQARERADAFQSEYPKSIHLAAIEAALRKAGGEP
jgi:hypothetical protein